MKRSLLFAALFLSFMSMADAQWRNTRKHMVLTAMAGGGSVSSEHFSSYQLIGRGMYYPKRIYAFGGELGYSQSFGQYKNSDAISFNGFMHLKLPFGFYAEGGLGAMSTISDGSSSDQPGIMGLFWSLGYAKKLGKRMAVELQYRKAPTIQAESMNMMQRNLRLGLSLKL
jgi:hypothetical protein